MCLYCLQNPSPPYFIGVFFLCCVEEDSQHQWQALLASHLHVRLPKTQTQSGGKTHGGGYGGAATPKIEKVIEANT